MNILVVGNGGREHALAWKLAQGRDVTGVFVAPGNAGTAREAKCRNVAIDAGDVDALIAFAREHDVALTVVGPEVPLVAGIRDRFDAAGLACFGPTAAAARIEGSKAFAKDFLVRHGIPTAGYETFTDLEAAERHIRAAGAPIVVKGDGLAAGKAVIVAESEAEALAAVRDMLGGDRFGAAGRRVVIEEFLDGEEASFICLCDGAKAVPFASSQDHKRRHDRDRGPNTGGMGAYSPAPVVDAAVHGRILEQVIEPTLAGMVADGAPYQGFLYAGLMIMADGSLRVIEFNCRFGDPEAQPVLARLESDLGELCLAALEHRLDGVALEWDPRVALGVVMAAGGYPEGYDKGDAIDGLDDVDAQAKVFHAGTREDGGRVLTNGGRVLCVVGFGDTTAAAADHTYANVRRIRWRDACYRGDIGYRAIARERGG